MAIGALGIGLTRIASTISAMTASGPQAPRFSIRLRNPSSSTIAPSTPVSPSAQYAATSASTASTPAQSFNHLARDGAASRRAARPQNTAATSGAESAKPNTPSETNPAVNVAPDAPVAAAAPSSATSSGAAHAGQLRQKITPLP